MASACLPSAVSLKFLHGCLRFCVPVGRLAAEVVLLDQRGLDSLRGLNNPYVVLDLCEAFFSWCGFKSACDGCVQQMQG